MISWTITVEPQTTSSYGSSDSFSSSASSLFGTQLRSTVYSSSGSVESLANGVWSRTTTAETISAGRTVVFGASAPIIEITNPPAASGVVSNTATVTQRTTEQATREYSYQTTRTTNIGRQETTTGGPMQTAASTFLRTITTPSTVPNSPLRATIFKAETLSGLHEVLWTANVAASNVAGLAPASNQAVSGQEFTIYPYQETAQSTALQQNTTENITSFTNPAVTSNVTWHNTSYNLGEVGSVIDKSVLPHETVVQNDTLLDVSRQDTNQSATFLPSQVVASGRDKRSTFTTADYFSILSTIPRDAGSTTAVSLITSTVSTQRTTTANVVARTLSATESEGVASSASARTRYETSEGNFYKAAPHLATSSRPFGNIALDDNLTANRVRESVYGETGYFENGLFVTCGEEIGSFDDFLNPENPPLFGSVQYGLASIAPGTKTFQQGFDASVVGIANFSSDSFSYTRSTQTDTDNISTASGSGLLTTGGEAQKTLLFTKTLLGGEYPEGATVVRNNALGVYQVYDSVGSRTQSFDYGATAFVGAQSSQTSAVISLSFLSPHTETGAGVVWAAFRNEVAVPTL